MTKAEEYDKAWRMGFNGDFSLVDKTTRRLFGI